MRGSGQHKDSGETGKDPSQGISQYFVSFHIDSHHDQGVRIIADGIEIPAEIGEIQQKRRKEQKDQANHEWNRDASCIPPVEVAHKVGERKIGILPVDEKVHIGKHNKRTQSCQDRFNPEFGYDHAVQYPQESHRKNREENNKNHGKLVMGVEVTADTRTESCHGSYGQIDPAGEDNKSQPHGYDPQVGSLPEEDCQIVGDCNGGNKQDRYDHRHDQYNG